MTTPLTVDPRPSRPPIQQAATGTVAAGIGQAVSALVIASNPELILLAPIFGTAATGILNGVGAAARNRINSGQGGILTLLAQLFAWLG